MAEKEYISREAAIAVIEEKQKELCPLGMYSRHSVYGSDREKFDAWQEIIDTLEAVPAADVRPVKRGKLTRHVLKNANVPWGFDCTACGAWFVIGEDTAEKYNFCPNCGADMRAEEGES